ncbi:MAG: hypothetical protein SGBAC_010663 [Bacillariaceae sp.]
MADYAYDGVTQGEAVQGEVYDGEGGDGGAGYSEGLPEVLYLMQYCAQAFAPEDDSEDARHAANLSWDPVRDWLQSHNEDEIRDAAEQRDDVGKTALHFACQHVPPTDVINIFLNVAGDIIQWPDSFGWLPIHYACAYDAEPTVIKNLAETFPESKTTVDRKGRTPLHFFLGTLGTQSTNSPDVVILLSNTGAASYPTDEGLLPLHLACAFGRSEETLYVLTDAYPEGATTVDHKQRTPLHFVLSNAGRKNAPAAVRLLLSQKPDLANSIEGGPLPLLVLAQFAITGIDRSNEEQLDAVQGCLKYILNSKPKPTPEFFSALQRLPSFLQDRAVVMKEVQEMLNDKIAQRFPTMILILDLYMQFVVLAAYMFAVTNSQHMRKKALLKCGDGIEDCPVNPEEIGFLHNADHDWDSEYRWLMVGGMFAGAFYFLLREIFQAISLAALGAFHIYIRDLSNWLNLVYILLVCVWATLVLLGEGSFFIFVYGTSLSVFVLIIKFLAYLRNVYIDFAIFSGGVFHVLSRLSAFIFCLVIFLVAFSRMFYTLFQETDYCANAPPFYDAYADNTTLRHQLILEIQCGTYDPSPWCSHWSAVLSVFTMLLGEVDEGRFIDDEVGWLAVLMFALFMFLMVILLANVLIAIVTDSYKVIQDERAAIVFWTNRLDFIAQMDAVANGPWKRKLRKMFGFSSRKKKSQGGKKTVFGESTWERMNNLLFEDDQDLGVFNIEFYCYFILKVITAAVIPIWFLLGIFTFGILWPPQIRRFFFTSSVTKLSESDKEDAMRKNQIENLHIEIEELKNELLKEMALDRTQVVQLKSSVAEKKLELKNEMKHIQRIVTMLFEQTGGIQSHSKKSTKVQSGKKKEKENIVGATDDAFSITNLNITKVYPLESLGIQSATDFYKKGMRQRSKPFSLPHFQVDVTCQTPISLPPNQEWKKRAPHVLILGAQKGGTTAMAYYLYNHPRFIYLPSKELHFFDDDMDAWRKDDSSDDSSDESLTNLNGNEILNRYIYESMIKDYNMTIFEQQQTMNPAYILDATPNYLFESDRVPQRVFCACGPWVKLIVFLRNPIDRAWSQYYMQHNFDSFGNLTKLPSFEEYIEMDMKVLKEVGVLPPPETADRTQYYGSAEETKAWKTYTRLGINTPLGRGLYSIQLRQWLQAMKDFGKPTSDLMVFSSEQMKVHSQAIYHQVLEFLEIHHSEHELSKFEPVHKTRYDENVKMKLETRKKLEDFYRPYNQQLKDVLGSEWDGIWDET